MNVIPVNKLIKPEGGYSLNVVASSGAWDIAGIGYAADGQECTIPGCGRAIMHLYYVKRADSEIVYGPIGSVCGPKLVYLSQTQEVWDDLKVRGIDPQSVSKTTWKDALARFKEAQMKDAQKMLISQLEVMRAYVDVKKSLTGGKIWHGFSKLLASDAPRMTVGQIGFLGDVMIAEPFETLVDEDKKKREAMVTRSTLPPDWLDEKMKVVWYKAIGVARNTAVPEDKRKLIVSFGDQMRKGLIPFPWKVRVIESHAKQFGLVLKEDEKVEMKRLGADTAT